MFLTFYTTRIVLNALGIVDFGIYGVIAGLTSMFSFINAAMTTATLRYLSFSLGENDKHSLSKNFSVSINIHICIAIITLLIANIGGVYLISNVLKLPTESIEIAKNVFFYSSITLAIGIMQVPFTSAVIAHEKMKVFAVFGVSDAFLKLFSGLAITIIEENRLITYSQLLAVTSFITAMMYFMYVMRHIREAKYVKAFKWDGYKDMLVFTGWNLLGNLAFLSRIQGLNILINIFFGVAFNAAYVIAMMLQSALIQFSTSLQQAINPQIIKNYAAANKRTTQQLMYASSKFSFLLVFMLIVPVSANLDYILYSWLSDAPEYTKVFARYVFAIVLIDVLSNSLMTGLQATGKMRNYQLVVSTVILLNLPLIYVSYSLLPVPEIALIIIALNSIIALILRLLFVRKYMGYDLKPYLIQVGTKIFVVCVIFGPLWIVVGNFNPFHGLGKLIYDILVCVIILASIVYVFGLSANEKKYVARLIKRQKSDSN